MAGNLDCETVTGTPPQGGVTIETRKEKSMTREEILNAVLPHYRKLAELELAGRDAEAESYYRRNRPAFQYDEKGNWIGPVANENGWTP